MTERDTDPILRRLFVELSEADQQLLESSKRLEHAQADYEIDSIKFVALRDMLAARLGHTPYTAKANKGGWSLTSDGQREHVDLPSHGRFRFYRMPLGDAVEAALAEIESPVTLADLTQMLSDGGLEWAGQRSVNGAITNKVGKTVGKTDDGEYYLLGSSIDPKSWEPPDPDDLPFEDAVGGDIDPEDLPFEN